MLDVSFYGITATLTEDFDEFEQMSGYEINLLRNFDVIEAESKLTVTLPNENEGCEVRYITQEEYVNDSQRAYYEKIVDELLNPTLTDQEFADIINKLFEEIYPVVESSYANGSYSVNTDKPGVFFVVPTGSMTFTAEDIPFIRENCYSEFGETPESLDESQETTESVVFEVVVLVAVLGVAVTAIFVLRKKRLSK